MKSLMLIAAVVCSMACIPVSAATTAPADDGDLIINVDQLNNKQFILHLANLEQQSTSIMIKDLSGTTYYRETVKDHNGFAKKINLRKLPEGRYVLSITQNDRQFTQVVLVDTEKLLFSKITEK